MNMYIMITKRNDEWWVSLMMPSGETVLGSIEHTKNPMVAHAYASTMLQNPYALLHPKSDRTYGELIYAAGMFMKHILGLDTKE